MPTHEIAPESAADPDTQATPPSGPPLQPISPPEPTLWRLRDLGFFLAFVAAALLVANFLTLVGYAVFRPLMGWHARPQDLDVNPFFLIVNQSIIYGLILGYIYFLVVVSYRLRFWSGLNWRPPTSRQVIGFVLGGVVLGIAIAHAPRLLPDREDFPLEQLFSSPRAAYAVGVFAVLVAPVIEELIFRGVLFAFFDHLVGSRFAIAMTALLFAGLHVPEYWGAWNHVLLIGVVAVTLSLARGLSGSLAPSVTLHLSYNLSLMVALFFASKHFHAIQSVLVR